MLNKLILAGAISGGLFIGGVVVLVVVLTGPFLGQVTPSPSFPRPGGKIVNGAGIPPELVPLIVKAADAAGCPEVTPALLAAQLQQESGFDPTARSPVGALGIAQFMPATWAAVGQGGDVWDPGDAIPAAARYDCAVSADVAGVPGDRVVNMLAGYNAGSGAVLSYGGVPPYPETQAYVQRIIAVAAGFGQDLTSPGEVPPGQIAPMIEFMRSQVGKPYVWGAAGPDAWDCSSLVQAAYATIGIPLHRVTFDQVNDGPPVSPADVRPGDLLFTAGSDGTRDNPGHVGMYVGDGRVIDAKGARWGVVEGSLSSWTDIVVVVRPLAGAQAK